MTKLCLIRHGETDWNKDQRLQGQEDIPLNENGINGAVECGEYLKRFGWDYIITSPLQRAIKTGELIGEKVGIREVFIENDLIERAFGEASGLTYKEKHEKYPDGIIKGCETIEEVQKRFIGSLETIAKKYDNKRVLVISHGACINIGITKLTNDKYDLKNTILKNCCMNFVEYDNDNWRFLEVNKTAKDFIDANKDPVF